MCRGERANSILEASFDNVGLQPSPCAVKPIFFFFCERLWFPCIGIMHRLNAPGRLFPTAAICTGIKMTNQAIEHVDNSLRKHHASALFTLAHCLLQYLRSPRALLGQFSRLK